MPKPNNRYQKRAWNTKEWKEKQSGIVNGQICQQCGSTDVLQIHHLNTNKKLYYIMQQRIVKQLVKDKMQNGEIPFKGKIIQGMCCPNCAHVLKITNSRYKNKICPKCGIKSQINSQNLTIQREYNYILSRSELMLFIRRFEEEINRIMTEKGAPPKPDYLNLTQDTIVLCKTCHYALENKHDLCPKCKKHYKKVGDLMCSFCVLN